MNRTIGALCLCGWILGSSAVPARTADDTGREFFERSVAPVFHASCVGCHGAAMQRSGLDLRTAESVLRGGARGAAVAPGNPARSLLYQLITHTAEPSMPMGRDRLSGADIEAVAAWIRGLRPVGTAPLAAAGAGHRPPGPVSVRDREFWSFQRPRRPGVPEARNPGWVRNAIDAFVLRALEAKGLHPSPEADGRALIRRLYFDLVGIPPSVDAVDGFVADRSEGAYEKVVDELLASPLYGERWGRHWLDLARYADSGGFEFDYDRPYAWRYRDWVIHAFNADLPYDRFVREQLAGDELDPGNPAALIPTGFCRNGPTVDNASTEQTRMDELDDMVATTSSVFLGLTVGCARCHDHKYDPIPQRDYYRMQAIFFPSKKTEALLVSADGEAAFKARSKELDALARPYREKIAELEKPHREKLLAGKVDFFVRLAERSGALEGKDREAYRNELAERFAKDVKLQPEEITALLSAEERAARAELEREIQRINRDRPKPLPTAMGVTDGPADEKCFILERGDFRQKGAEVSPGFPSVLDATGGALAVPQPDAKSTGRRRQLAEWIASADNPLTARVAVNRIWQHHFGRGIVATASDFGSSGERPSHPELLDWLATEFVARDWSIKAMHRLIVTSAAYRQSAGYDAKAAGIDPENRLLWRMGPRRLESEAVRDEILAVSGKLNRKMGGPGIYPRIEPGVIATGSTNKWPVDVHEGEAEWRRSVYVFVKRSVLLPILEVFDCPETTVSTARRNISTVAPQALALLNNQFVLEQAGHFAGRVAKIAGPGVLAQVQHAWRMALARPPTSKEQAWALEFLERQSAGYRTRVGGAPIGAEREGENPALRDLCHALFNTSEFLYVD